MKKPIRRNEGTLHNGRTNFTALIVEDDDIYRSLYRKRLRTIVPRARIVEAEDGYAALLKVAEDTPDVVLLDLHTPSFSGIEFLEILKKHDEYAALPVVVITSSPSESVTKFQSLPNVHIFHKPIRISLLDRILSLIVKKSGLQGASDPDKFQENLDIYLGNDPGVQREVAKLFYDSAAERLAELEVCLCSSNMTRLREWCHATKGSVSLFGAAELLSLIANLRSACINGDHEMIELSSGAVIREFRSFVVQLGVRFGFDDNREDNVAI